MTSPQTPKITVATDEQTESEQTTSESEEPTLPVVQFPDTSHGVVTDIRVTATDIKLDADSAAIALWGDWVLEKELTQVWYGYKIDGVWYDFPSEYYDLRCLTDSRKTGFDATFMEHAVLIGDYVLISVKDRSSNHSLEVEDTVGTEAFYPFVEHSDFFNDEVEYHIGHYYEDPELILKGEEVSGTVTFPFVSRGYLIVHLSEIDSEYQVTYRYQQRGTEEIVERHFSGDLILAVLEGE